MTNRVEPVSLHAVISVLILIMFLQLGVKAVTVEDLVQAQKEIMAHNMQLKEQTKQLERDMAELKDQSLRLVSSYYM